MVGWTNLWKIEEKILKCGRINIDKPMQVDMGSGIR